MRVLGKLMKALVNFIKASVYIIGIFFQVMRVFAELIKALINLMREREYR